MCSPAGINGPLGPNFCLAMIQSGLVRKIIAGTRQLSPRTEWLWFIDYCSLAPPRYFWWLVNISNLFSEHYCILNCMYIIWWSAVFLSLKRLNRYNSKRYDIITNHDEITTAGTRYAKYPKIPPNSMIFKRPRILQSSYLQLTVSRWKIKPILFKKYF